MNNQQIFTKKTSICCKGQLIDLTTPRITGIINVTPDSFYAGSRSRTIIETEEKIEKYISEGADFIDIGATSTRPGSTPVSVEEEWKRLEPSLQVLLKNYPDVLYSVDTFHHEIAERAVSDFGAAMINDISGGNLDNRMIETIARLQVPYIIMHMRDRPEKMMENTNYHSLVNEIIGYFSEKTELLKTKGIHDIIIDPGFGFSKTIEQNFVLLHGLEAFRIFEFPLMVGLSRKSMIYKTLEITPEEALNGTTVLHTIALLKGVSFLRVHDVKEAKESIRLISFFKKVNNL